KTQLPDQSGKKDLLRFLNCNLWKCNTAAKAVHAKDPFLTDVLLNLCDAVQTLSRAGEYRELVILNLEFFNDTRPPFSGFSR
ncbi:MAG TPA: hypothetical protein PLZ55_12845, partial [bacterium]|nr:hypothetical protein [bacterium]